MNAPDTKVESDRQLLEAAKNRGPLATLAAYVKLSGPGWLQSAITLGGGSLGGSLYLGVLAGFSLLWLQPVAMILGIIMLSAIGYVTLTTGERPFHAINRHVSPILGWGWALATLAANVVWSLPQYSLANGVLQQNLLPGLVGPEGTFGDTGGKLLVAITILIVTIVITWCYDRGGWGIKLYEAILKGMVAVIVLCFFGVVIRLTFAQDAGMDWGAIVAGFVPNPAAIFSPAESFRPLLDSISADARSFWTAQIVDKQRDVLMTAAATAVGINMTFLFPYTLLKRGWGKEFRGLTRFDLSIGMFVPFVLATSCVVIASASQFHAKPHPGFHFEGTPSPSAAKVSPSPRQESEYVGRLNKRVLLGENSGLSDLELQARRKALPVAEKKLAATLVTRDAFDLARSLAPLTGHAIANLIFGIGVLGMTLSTITLLMLISGFVICEMFSLPHNGWPYRIATLAAATGALGPFFWSKAAFWLAVPTSIFGLTLLPIAYITFFLLMNRKSLLGDAMPRGTNRLIWNTSMGVAVVISTVGSAWAIWLKLFA